MSYTKSIAILLTTAVCATAFAVDAGAQSRGRSSGGRPSGGRPSAGQAAPRSSGPRTSAPRGDGGRYDARRYAPRGDGRYDSRIIVRAPLRSDYYPYYYVSRPGLSIGLVFYPAYPHLYRD